MSPPSEFSALRNIIISSLDTYEAELAKLDLAPPSIFHPAFHPTDDSSFLPSHELYSARDHLVAALGMMTSLVQNPIHRYWMLCNQHHTTSSLNAVARTEIPVILLEAGTEGMSSVEIAERAGVSEPKLIKILRYLTNQHIFRETKEGYFAHTRTSIPLVRGNPASHLALYSTTASILGAPIFTDVLLDPKKGPSRSPLDSSLAVAAKFEELGVSGYFEWISKFHPKALEGMNVAIATYGDLGLAGILADFPWEDVANNKTVVDIGGGRGGLILPLLKKYPAIKGVLQDIDQTVREAEKNFVDNLPEAISGGRVSLETYDFFTPQPYRGPEYVYVLRHVLHDWSDELSLKILDQVVGVMTTESRLLIIEHLSKLTTLDPSGRNEDGTPSTKDSVPYPLPISLGVAGQPDYALDFEMMASLNALDRSQAQYEALVTAAGLKVVKVWPARGPNSVIEVALA